MSRSSRPFCCLLFFLAFPLLSQAASWEMGAQRQLEALRRGDVDAAKKYFGVENGVRLSELDIVQDALPAALQSGSIELVKFLKSRGWLDVCRKVQERHRAGARPECNPIHMAVSAGAKSNVELLRFLVADGFDPASYDQLGRTPFHIAAEAGHLSVVKYFCEQRLDNNVTTNNRDAATPLELAARAVVGGDPRTEEVIDYLKGRDCRSGTISYGPTFSRLPSSRSASIDSTKRALDLTYGPLLGYAAPRLCAGFRDASFQCWTGEELPRVFDHVLPVIDPSSKVTAVQGTSSGIDNCVVVNTGAAKCWGANNWGQLGLGDTAPRNVDSPERIASLPFVDLGSGTKARTIIAGAHTCVLLTNGSVKCWGFNAEGQLGLGDTRSRGARPNEMGAHLAIVDLGSKYRARQIASSDTHTCVLLGNGTIKCWGLNNLGQLGLGDRRNRGAGEGQMGDRLQPVDLGKGLKPIQVATGAYHTCALFENGKIKCWGGNFRGQLGLGDARSRGDHPNDMGDALPFVDLGSGVRAVQVMTNREWNGTCALLTNGGVKCWGYNGRGYFASDMGDNLPYVKFQK